MKSIRIAVLALFMGAAFTACNEPEQSYETDDERVEEEANMNSEDAENEEEDNGIDVGVSVDEEGNVDGEAEGNIEIGDDDDDK
jgi:hypothetical protein